MSTPTVLRGWPVVAVVALLSVVVLAATGGAGARVGTRTIGTYVVDRGCDATGQRAANCPATPPGRQPTGRVREVPVVVSLFSGFGISVTAVFALIALAAALVIGMTLLAALSTAAGSIATRRRSDDVVDPAAPEPGAASVIETAAGLDAAAGAALAALDEGTDPRQAVIAAWLGLEQAAARAGTQRRPAETPGELAQRLLAGHAVSPVTLARLAGLYREARYSRHVVDERMRAEARRALERLRRELTAAVGG